MSELRARVLKPAAPRAPTRIRARLAGGASWSCPFPVEADGRGIDDAVVRLRVDVGTDGRVVSVRMSSPITPSATECRSVDALPAETSPSPDRRLDGTVWSRFPLARAGYRSVSSLAAAIGQLGISADAFTYTSLLLSFGAGCAAATGRLSAAAMLVLAGGFFDLLDGAVARATGTSSRWGALLDSTVDRLSDGLPLLGLVVLYGHRGWLAAVPGLAMLGALTLSYTRARAEALGVSLPPLFMRRAERLVVLVLSLLASAIPFPAASLPLLGVAALALGNFVGLGSAMRVARRSLTLPPRAP